MVLIVRWSLIGVKMNKICKSLCQQNEVLCVLWESLSQSLKGAPLHAMSFVNGQCLHELRHRENGSGTCFTNRLKAHNWNLVKINFWLILILAIYIRSEFCTSHDSGAGHYFICKSNWYFCEIWIISQTAQKETATQLHHDTDSIISKTPLTF